MAVGRTRGRVLAATTLVGVLLAGCSGQPGAAAVVDGRTITTAELAAVQAELSPIYQRVGTTDALAVLITEPFASRIAAERGVGVSDEQALELLRSNAVAVLGEEEAAALEFGPGSIAVGRYSLAVTALQDLPDAQEAAQTYSERLAEADIEVNPRFGEFTDDLVVVAPATPSWIVPEGGRDAGGDEAPADGQAPAGEAPDGEAP